MTILGEVGVWVWGSATAILGIAVVSIIFTGKPQDLYVRVKDSATALGAVIAASALAWSLFYQSSDQAERIESIERSVRAIEETLEGK
jgi:hypothetical protein